MVEKINKVSNPLTIIAIFAALAEINGTIAIGLVGREYVDIFIWFLIGFPTLLILLFFLTLNFNPKVIYAPSDFKNEENFLKTFSSNLYFDKINYKISSELNNIEIIKGQVNEAIKVSEQAIQLPIEERHLMGKANTFFKIFMEKIQFLLDENKLQELTFSYHTPEFFHLDFLIPQKNLTLLNSKNAYVFIVRLKVESSKQITLELIGSGIIETEEEKFASKVATLVKGIVEIKSKPT